MVHVRFGILGVLVALAVTASTCALAVPNVQTYAVTSSALSADNPSVWGNYVVWQATGSGGTDIFAANITTGNVAPSQIMTVCSAAGVQSNPTVGTGFVAWEDRRSDALSDLFAASANWSAGTFAGFQVSGRSGAELNPAIWGDTLVYNYNNGSYTIQSYNLKTRTLLPVVAAGSAQKGAPAINDDYVLWQDARAGTGNYDIWSLNRTASNDFVAVSGSGSQLNPAIYGNAIAWNEVSSGYYRIGFRNVGGSSTFIPNGTFDMKLPSIYGDYVVWQDKRNGNWDIYGYQISTGTTFVVAGGTGDQDKPQVFGNMVVYRELIGSSSQIRYAVFGGTAAVPEPGSIVALLTGLLGTLGVISRRRSG